MSARGFSMHHIVAQQFGSGAKRDILPCMSSFWDTLPQPFFVQAPLEDVTDAAFRRMFARHGKPDVTWTEFTSADGLALAPESGQRKLRAKLMYDESERPIVAQLFSSRPERMEMAARIAAELGFDGIDINMGCPDKAVEKGGAGAALIKTPDVARAIIIAAQSAGLPVSVKTRVGYNTVQMDWLRMLLGTGIHALSVHARTRKEMSLVPARWEHVAEAVRMRDELGVPVKVIGNGDVQSMAEARARVAETGCDGVMIGRGLFGNPWFFRGLQDSRTAENKDIASPYFPTPQERVAALAEHLTLFEELLGDITAYPTMKKHFKAYINGWPNASDLRARLMETGNAQEAIAILKESCDN
jgi:nifR3 family TIM-barrel protein